MRKALFLLPLLAGCRYVLPPRPISPPEPARSEVTILIVEETAERPTLPAAQLAIFTDPSIREYAKRHGDRLRILDKDHPTKEEPWREGLDRPRKSLPWLLATNGKHGVAGPLPKSVDSLLEVLKRYGGE